MGNTAPESTAPRAASGGGRAGPRPAGADAGEGRASEQRVAVITGASSGIGEATARELTARGWQCVLLARRADRLEALARELACEFERCDVSDRADVERTAAAVTERHPRIGLLVNNAGIAGRGSFVDVHPELIERVMATNYLGGIWCLRAFLPALEAAGDAHVVNVVSVAGTVAFAPAGPYTASKHAQLAFSRSAAALLRGNGIRVHTVLPGFVETEGFPQHTTLRSALMRRFVIETPRVAKAIADAVEHDKREITVPWFPYRIVSVLQAAVPGVFARVVGRFGYRPV